MALEFMDSSQKMAKFQKIWMSVVVTRMILMESPCIIIIFHTHLSFHGPLAASRDAQRFLITSVDLPNMDATINVYRTELKCWHAVSNNVVLHLYKYIAYCMYLSIDIKLNNLIIIRPV